MAQQTANEALYDAIIRHQTYLMRYSGYVRNRVNAVLDKSEQAIADLVRGRLADTLGLSTPQEVRRMEALLTALDAIRTDAWDKAREELYDQLTSLAYQEPIVLRGMFTAVAPAVVNTVLPTSRLLKAIALSRPFEGRILKDWAATMQAEDLRRIHAAIQTGMVAGESSAAIARRVVGTQALGGVDGMTQMTRRQVEAITRTAVNHIANSARDAFIAENADIVEAEVYVATLDARTTPICKALDGKVFPTGTGPRPPQHFGCRSLRAPVIDGSALSGRPYKASTTKQLLREYAEKNGVPVVTSRNDLARGHKGTFDEFARKRVRELTGRVPAGTSYQQWLTRQTKEFQDDTLGVTRAKLFRDGKLTLDKFVTANGHELTLAELAKRHADAFRAAGLEPGDFI